MAEPSRGRRRDRLGLIGVVALFVLIAPALEPFREDEYQRYKARMDELREFQDRYNRESK